MGHLSNTKAHHRKFFIKVQKDMADFKAYFAYILLGILTKFLVNPYNEPLL